MKKQWKKLNLQTFRPSKEGDKIEGVLVNKVLRQNGNSSKYYLSNEKGAFLVYGTMLLDERMQFCQPGQLVRITYDGKAELKDNEYKLNLYTVEVADIDYERKEDVKENI